MPAGMADPSAKRSEGMPLPASVVFCATLPGGASLGRCYATAGFGTCRISPTCREAEGTEASNEERHRRGAGLARAGISGATGLTWVPQLHVAHVGGQWPGLVSSGQVSTHSAPRKREPRFVSWIRKTAKTRKRSLFNTGAEDSTRLLESSKAGAVGTRREVRASGS